MTRKAEIDTRNRMVTLLREALILPISAYHILFTSTGCGDETSSTEYFLLVLSGGYFIYDLFAKAWFDLLDIDMAIHHLLCIISMLVSVAQNVGTGYIVFGMLVTEISVPPMLIRTMLRNMGKRYTWAYEVAEYTYLITFFIVRVVFGHLAVYYSLACPALSRVTQLASLGIAAQSYLLFYRMYFVLDSRIKETTERRERKIKLKWLRKLSTEILQDCQFYLASQKKKLRMP